MTTIKDLNVNDFKVLVQDLVKETIEQTLDEYLEDPDSNKILKEEVKNRLIESKKKTDAGEKGISIEEAIKKLNIPQ